MNTDSRVQQELLQRFWQAPGISTAGVSLTVREGIVTLRGHVADLRQKCRLEDLVQHHPGVRAMVVALRVPLAETPLTDDQDLAQRAVSEVAPYEVPQVKIKVEAGRITLRGEVPESDLKEELLAAVARLAGVRGVINRLVVHPVVSAPDVEARIREAFERSALQDADRVGVEVRADNVILRGQVRSWQERRDAAAAAWSVPGVLHVEDHLVVVEC
ncbi:Osmotically-inducible protein OsmY, contains BON domain [Catalinimonas alkaloidigena]|uniref:Osmotically-inducible protein OsmY, contains BON domain n=1 Tax=Catalinimonas alkaloidigena TaxID=1075417 RepID=A0A1G9P0J9_9BACT|nr:BON domain-containing protein [Catalinimonas alkaloidigena]SDL91745.1 Osmotically-inducible protein OsmY, contains BON domain [Catalinimonas alkaloidigena]